MNGTRVKQDRRIDRTVSSLRKALTELILEKHYDLITVQDIIDRANVGRSTFYTHFRDKEDVLIGDWKRILGFFVESINFEYAGKTRFVPVRELMLHLKEFHALYRALVRSGKAERLFATGTSYLANGIEVKIAAFAGPETQPSVPPAVSAHFVALQIFGLLKWWLDHNMPYSPEEMDEMFHTLVAPGIVDALKSSERADVKAQAAHGQPPRGFHQHNN